MVEIVETADPQGSATAPDSVAGDPTDTHSDDGAVELVIVDEQRAASPDSDEGEDDPAGAEHESEDGPEGLEDELRQIRKPKLREQMRQLRQENWRAKQVLAHFAQERQHVGATLQQLQARAIAAEARALDTEIGSLQRHQQWLQQQYTAKAGEGDAASLGQITAAMAEANNRLMQVQSMRRQYGNVGQPPPQQFQPPQMPRQPGPAPQRPVILDSAAQKWMQDHASWHRNDPNRLQAVGIEAQRLQAEGIPPEDPEHYPRLNKVLAARYDDFRPATGAARRQNGGSSAVTPVARTTTAGGKTRYEITAEDAAFLKRQGLDPKTNPQGFKEWRAARDAIAKSGAMDGRGKIAIQIDA